MEEQTMVLIHGNWQGSWAFSRWRPHLAQRGWQTYAVDLPGNGCNPADQTCPQNVSLELYTAHVVKLLRRIDHPVVLLGHSMGGITASQVAEAVPELVKCLVYLAGVMLPSHMSYQQLVKKYLMGHPWAAIGGIDSHLQISDDGLTSTVPVEAARTVFLHDCPEPLALEAAGKMRPQPEAARASAPTLTEQRYGRVPRIYIETLDDKALHLPLQWQMQMRSPDALRMSLQCGHMPQLGMPEALTALLCPVLENALHLKTATIH